MWYFTWALGTLFAASMGIINALWLERSYDMDADSDSQNQ